MKFFNKIFNNREKTENKLGTFSLNDFPKGDRKNDFYFLKYFKNDGEWIEIDEPICKIRLGDYHEIFFCKSATIWSSQSGYLEHLKNEEELLYENDVIYKIHEKGIYENENSIDNSDFKYFFQHNSKDDILESFYFDKWFKQDGDIVEKGETIFQYKDSNFNLVKHCAEKNGYIDISESGNTVLLTQNQLIYTIRDNFDKIIERKFINIPIVLLDEFTNSKKITWKEVSSLLPLTKGIQSKSDNKLIDFTFSLNYISDNDNIVFYFNPNQIRPQIDDKISFLFENNEQIEFCLKAKPLSIKNRFNENIIEVKSLITKSELDIFKNQNFKKWKISLQNGEIEYLGGEIGGDKNYESKNNLVFVIKKFTKDYTKIVESEILNYKPLIINDSIDNSSKSNDICYVYLMCDTTNGYHKIGISNNPKYREYTLQSEKPTIEMLIAKKFPIRKIAESFEKSLHETFSTKRIRGEWFDLSENDNKHLKESLK